MERGVGVRERLAFHQFLIEFCGLIVMPLGKNGKGSPGFAVKIRVSIMKLP
jgi:hypothetical protein